MLQYPVTNNRNGNYMNLIKTQDRSHTHSHPHTVTHTLSELYMMYPLFKIMKLYKKVLFRALKSHCFTLVFTFDHLWRKEEKQETDVCSDE